MTDTPADIKKAIGDKIPRDVALAVSYKNYRGETSDRKIIPLEIFFGNTEYHKEDQWLLKVWDLDKNDYQTYALKDIENWREFP